jgi:hypothetical protein
MTPFAILFYNNNFRLSLFHNVSPVRKFDASAMICSSGKTSVDLLAPQNMPAKQSTTVRRSDIEAEIPE